MKVVVNKETVRKTNELWGKDEVTDCAMEEFAEAIQAVSKVRRFPKDKRTYENLNDEIADVLIAIDALEDLGLIDAESVQQFIDFKQNRQKARNVNKELLMHAKEKKQ